MAGFVGFWEYLGECRQVLEGFRRSRKVLFQVQISLNQIKNLKPLLLLQQYFLSILNIEIARSYNIQSNQTGSLLGDFGNI